MCVLEGDLQMLCGEASSPGTPRGAPRPSDCTVTCRDARNTLG